MSDTTNAIWHWILDAAIGFAIALLTLAIIGVLSYRETRNLISQQQAVNHSYQALRNINSAEADISEQDRAELAYVLTHDPQKLQQRQNIANRLQQDIQSIQEFAGNDPAQQQLFTRMQASLASKDKYWQQLWQQLSIQSNGKTGASSVPNSAALLELENIGEKIKSSLAEMIAEQEHMLAQHRQEYEISAARAGRTVIVMVLFTFVFLGTAYRSIRKDIRTRRQTEFALHDLQKQLQDALEKEKELARLDSLTGLSNRRAFYEVLEIEQKRARRYELPLTVAYLDVDNFKKINDSSGHALGDSVLVLVAQTIKSNIRETDTVARLGGDEFAVLLPETEAAAAEIVLRKLQGMLRSKTQEQGWNVSFSIGVASFLFPPECLDDIIRTADEVMYAVKTSGKNNLSVAILG